MPTMAEEVAVAMVTAQGPTITSTTWLRMMAKGGPSGLTADASQDKFVHRFHYATRGRVWKMHMSDAPARAMCCMPCAQHNA